MAKEYAVGYQRVDLTLEGDVLRYGSAFVVMTDGGQDHAPGDVASVKLLTPRRTVERNKHDGAIITLRGESHTPIQEFKGPRQFVEATEYDMIWVGRAPTGETVTYNPNGVMPINKRGIRGRGSLVYGQGWLGSWINIGDNPAKLLEFCIPTFKNDKTIIEHKVDDPTVDLWYWKMWHAVNDNIGK